MSKKVIKYVIGQGTISRLRHFRDRSRDLLVQAINRVRGVKYINLGAGADGNRIGWWAGDAQTGFIFDNHTRLPQADNSIEFAYSSMFFEHLRDDTLS